MRLFKYNSTFLILWLTSLSAWSQQPQLKTNPFYDYLRTQADSTLVFSYSGTWRAQQQFTILAKKGDVISYYKYVGSLAFNTLDSVNPDAIQNRFKKMRKFSRRIVNQKKSEYYFIYPKNGPEKKLLWQNVLVNNPWGIKDDKAEGSGCPPSSNGDTIEIFDGTRWYLTLITKSGIKTLYFHEPQRYEEHCPGREGRKAIIKISALFRE